MRNLDQPNEVVTVGDYEDLKRARQLFQSPEFWAATQRAGVIGRPEVSFLEEVERLPPEGWTLTIQFKETTELTHRWLCPILNSRVLS